MSASGRVDAYEPVEFDRIRGEMDDAERRTVQARAEQLQAELDSLRAIRAYVEKSQTEVAAALGVSQPSVSRMEAGADLLLSSLRNYVEGLGGRLKLVVELPDRPPIELDYIGDLTDRTAASETDGGPLAGRRSGRIFRARSGE
jgi:DNA-binding XRE family transcriptional regulator